VAPLTLALALALARDRPAFLDRVEGDRAVLLDRGRTRSVPRDRLRGKPAEGTVVRGGAADAKATKAARRESRKAADAVPWSER
jgi:hypothetical protein